MEEEFLKNFFKKVGESYKKGGYKYIGDILSDGKVLYIDKEAKGAKVILHHKYIFFRTLAYVISVLTEHKADDITDEILFSPKNLNIISFVKRRDNIVSSYEKIRNWSYSEAEASAIYLILKIVENLELKTKRIEEIIEQSILEAFEAILEEVRPEKLNRSPYYPELTIGKVKLLIKLEKGELTEESYKEKLEELKEKIRNQEIKLKEEAREEDRDDNEGYEYKPKKPRLR